MAEAQMVIFDVAEEVMRKTGISAQEVLLLFSLACAL